MEPTHKSFVVPPLGGLKMGRIARRRLKAGRRTLVRGVYARAQRRTKSTELTHCPSGGIGRRAGFRSPWGQPRGGSIPLLGTSFLDIRAQQPQLANQGAVNPASTIFFLDHRGRRRAAVGFPVNRSNSSAVRRLGGESPVRASQSAIALRNRPRSCPYAD